MHLYHCSDKSRLQCQAVLIYHSEEKSVKLKTPHNKKLQEHRLKKVENAIEALRAQTREGVVTDISEHELEQIITNILIEDRYATTSTLKLILKSKLGLNI